MLEATRVCALWRSDGRVAGVVCDDGRAVTARGTILATGGAAALWSRTTNPPGSMGIGMLLALKAGARLGGHGARAVPPDRRHGHPGARGLPRHRGDPRRGRDASRPRRRAVRRRTGSARRGGARDLGGDAARRRRPRLAGHAGGRPGTLPERRRGAARVGPRPGERADPGGARRALRDGRRRLRPPRRDLGERAVRRRRDVLHWTARRQPARL